MNRERITLLVRYFLTGIFGAFIQVIALWLWVSVFRLESLYLWGVAVGFCIALLVTFPIQKYWSFRDASPDLGRSQFVRYTVIALISLALNTALLHVAKVTLENLHIDFFRVWYLLAEAGIVGAIAVLSFLLNRLFTFRRVDLSEAE